MAAYSNASVTVSFAPLLPLSALTAAYSNGVRIEMGTEITQHPGHARRAAPSAKPYHA